MGDSRRRTRPGAAARRPGPSGRRAVALVSHLRPVLRRARARRRAGRAVPRLQRLAARVLQRRSRAPARRRARAAERPRRGARRSAPLRARARVPRRDDAAESRARAHARRSVLGSALVAARRAGRPARGARGNDAGPSAVRPRPLRQLRAAPCLLASARAADRLRRARDGRRARAPPRTARRVPRERLRLASALARAHFRRQCFVTCDPNERTLPAVVALAGEDVVLFATDYPHPDALAGDLVGRITAHAELSPSAQEKILRRNAQRCFGLA
ncbi:MAG: hypothetical protein E6J87_16355 [Deltaproteobacteria bacterium]|nr:MAG: hypothetical protein E6J87_16355 [Deltaproteobacteria bacterium]